MRLEPRRLFSLHVPLHHTELKAEDEVYRALSVEHFAAFVFHLERLADPEFRCQAAEAHELRQPRGSRRPTSTYQRPASRTGAAQAGSQARTELLLHYLNCLDFSAMSALALGEELPPFGPGDWWQSYRTNTSTRNPTNYLTHIRTLLTT